MAILAGYWNEGVGVMLMSEGGIKMVWVATDDEVYSTFQPHLDQFLGQNSFVLDTKQMRKRYWRPHDLANCAISLKKSGKLDEIAGSWLCFKRKDENEKETTGKELIKQAIDKLLSPLTRNPTVQNIQISLNIDTGNMIYQEFEDFEAAMEFIQRHVQNPDQILARIMPKPKVKVKDDSS